MKHAQKYNRYQLVLSQGYRFSFCLTSGLLSGIVLQAGLGPQNYWDNYTGVFTGLMPFMSCQHQYQNLKRLL